MPLPIVSEAVWQKVLFEFSGNCERAISEIERRLKEGNPHIIGAVDMFTLCKRDAEDIRNTAYFLYRMLELQAEEDAKARKPHCEEPTG